MNLRKPIQGRSGPSKQQFLHNDLLQWAWKLPQPAAFITHKLQQTAFCFIHFFHSLPLGANLRPSSLPFSGRLEFLLTSSIHLVWGHRSRRFLAASRVTLFLHFLFVLAVAVMIFSLGKSWPGECCHRPLYEPVDRFEADWWHMIY